MLRPRLIPCLLVKNGGLVKTVEFAQPKYVGDPLNAVRIFNEKEVDELMVLDIDATRESRPPHYEMIASLAAECRMPLCYGGGVNRVEQAERIIGMGVEKVALGTAAIEMPELVRQISDVVGSQSVVTVLDVRRSGPRQAPEVFTRNGTVKTGRSPCDLARSLEDSGAGEIVVNSIDRDGRMSGYDRSLVRDLRKATTLPLTVLGGAGSLEDFRSLFAEFGVIGAAAGSLFVFKGPYRAVLINYPRRQEKESLFVSATTA